MLEVGFTILHAGCEEGCELERNPLEGFVLPENLGYEDSDDLGDHFGGSKCGTIVRVHDVYNDAQDAVIAIPQDGQTEARVNDQLVLRKKEGQ